MHRDIKPENLMLSSGGEIKVADFGLARITHTPENVKLTQVGMTMGSPLYMSPEQVEGKPLDPRSDIYSFGVTCYQMLAGRPPFESDTALNLAVQHLRAAPERLENLRPDLPPGLCRIVHKMLSKDPQDRFANGAEVLRELRGLYIEGLEATWPDQLDHFNTAEIVALAGARSSATRRLASAMAADPSARPLYRQPWLWTVVALAFVFGIVLAWPRPERSLLEGVFQQQEDLPKMADAEEQYRYAMVIGTEAGWQSVLMHYGDDPHHARLARKQLAELYLTQDRFYESLDLFDEFARMGDAEQDYLAYGLAGQYVVYSLTDRPDLAATKFGELWPLHQQLSRFDPQMTRRVFLLARKSQQLADREKRREIDDWLERHLADPADPGGSAPSNLGG